MSFIGLADDEPTSARTSSLSSPPTPSGLTGRTPSPDGRERQRPAPAGHPIPDQDATEDTTWTYVVPENAFTDEDLDTGDTLTWSVDNGDGTTLPAWLRFDPATRTIEGTPSRERHRRAVPAGDGDRHGRPVPESGLTLRIARINHPPTVGKAIPEQKAIQDQEFTFTFGRDTFKEQDDGDTLAYDAVQKDGTPLPSWLRFARSDRTFNGMPRDSDVGTLVVTVTAMDKAWRHGRDRLRAQGRQRQ